MTVQELEKLVVKDEHGIPTVVCEDMETFTEIVDAWIEHHSKKK